MLGASTAVMFVVAFISRVRSTRPDVLGSGLLPMGTGNRMQFQSTLSFLGSKVVSIPAFVLAHSMLLYQLPFTARMDGFMDSSPEGVRVVTKNTS